MAQRESQLVAEGLAGPVPLVPVLDGKLPLIGAWPSRVACATPYRRSQLSDEKSGSGSN
jgi:hypothetical protein